LKFSEDRKISVGLRTLLECMLEKDPSKRPSIDKLRENYWINEGYEVPLSAEKAEQVPKVTEEEIRNAILPIHAVVFAVTVLSYPIPLEKVHQGVEEEDGFEA